MIKRTINKKKKPIIISQSVKQTEAPEEYKGNQTWHIPYKITISDEHTFYNMVMDFLETNPAPWTHAKLSISLGIGTAEDLYEYYKKGGLYKHALDIFNLRLEDDLCRGALLDVYQTSFVQMYLKVHMKKYTDADKKDKTSSQPKTVTFNMLSVGSKAELDNLCNKSSELGKLLGMGDQLDELGAE